MAADPNNAANEYLPQLQAEKDNLDPAFVHAARLLAEEIDKVNSGGAGNKEQPKYRELHSEKPQKYAEKIIIPIKEFPKFNFVGRLLGPKGSTLKQLQEQTGCKMSILGKGCMRDKKKEEELRKEGGKYAHLNDELHVLCEVFATPEDAHTRMSFAFTELKKYLVPVQDEYDEIRQAQMSELQYYGDENGAQMGGQMGQMLPSPARGRGRGRGAPGAPPASGGAVNGAQTRGRGRGAYGAPPTRGGRGGATPLLGSGPPSRGARGGPMAARGATRGAAPRGAPSARGATRGAARGGLGARPEPLMSQAGYEEDYSGYGQTTAAYDDGYGGYDQSYGQEGYEQAGYGSTASDTQFYDYGHGTATTAPSRQAEYEDYGAGDTWGQSAGAGGYGAGTYGKAPAARGQARAHPYGSAGRGQPRY